MKLKKLFSIVMVIILLIGTTGNVWAANDIATVYFKGEGISNLSKNSEVNLISNNVTIDIEKEKITNEFIIQNALNAEKAYTFSIPLANKQTGTTAENVEIKINKTKVEPKIEERDNKVYYTIATKMQPGEYKKIQIIYNSPNMKNLPKIEYELENFGIEKVIKNVQVKIIVPEIDVPLVKNVQPTNYTFEDNVITYSYQNMNITDLNRLFVLEKEVYEDKFAYEKQIKGEFERTKVFGLSREEFLTKVKELFDANYKTWIRDGINLNIQDTVNTNQIIDNILNDNKISSTYTYLDGTGKEQAAKYELGKTFEKLYNYVILRQWIRENRQDLIGQYYHKTAENEKGILQTFKGQPLTLEYVRKNCELEGLEFKNLLIVVDIPNIQKEIYQVVNTTQNNNGQNTGTNNQVNNNQQNTVTNNQVNNNQQNTVTNNQVNNSQQNTVTNNQVNNNQQNTVTNNQVNNNQQNTVTNNQANNNQTNSQTNNGLNVAQVQATTLTKLYEQVQKEDRSEKIVYIPGNSTLSEEKRAEFANSIGADLYIRLQIKELEEQKNNILRETLRIPFLVINEWTANFESGKTVVTVSEESSYQNSSAIIRQTVEQGVNSIIQNRQNLEKQKRAIDDELKTIDQNLKPEQVIKVEDVIPEEDKENKGKINILTIILVVIVIGIVLCITLIAIGVFRKNR